MPGLVAALLVFFSSAAILVLEILAGRLLAPYVGVSLETFTAVIGTVLAGIAAGAWGGGWLADRVDPRRLLGPCIALGGVLALVTVPIVRATGDSATDGGAWETTLLTLAGFFAPALILASVSPMVVKIQLRDLAQTGGVVGWLSGVGTFGALVGTFVTGFLLVAAAPTTTVIYAVGGALVVVGVVVGLWLSRRDRVVLACLVVAAGGGAFLTATAAQPCLTESAYFCMRIERDLARSSGRILWLDNYMHSYVDLDDPSYLDFSYARSFAAAVDVTWPDGEDIDALHIGGGGFSLPRYLDATRPGARNTVLEIDPVVVDVAREHLGLQTSQRLRVRTGDARLGIRSLPDASVDLVVGDAFGGLSVPWHLTTREFVTEVRRVLRPNGLYIVNVVDDPPFRFAKAELATLREQFDSVVATSGPFAFQGEIGDNVVLVASDRAIETDDLAARVRTHGSVARFGQSLTRWIGDAPVLTDDHAPVDQWLARSRA